MVRPVSWALRLRFPFRTCLQVILCFLPHILHFLWWEHDGEQKQANHVVHVTNGLKGVTDLGKQAVVFGSVLCALSILPSFLCSLVSGYTQFLIKLELLSSSKTQILLVIHHACSCQIQITFTKSVQTTLMHQQPCLPAQTGCIMEYYSWINTRLYYSKWVDAEQIFPFWASIMATVS